MISGQQLPKQKELRLNEFLIPIAEIEFISQDSDILSRFRTKSIKGNCANPLWKEECSFVIQYPDMAFIRFQVLDNDTKLGSVLGTYCIALVSLEQGYRHVPLYNKKGDRLPFSTLFVFIHLEPTSYSPKMSKGKSSTLINKLIPVNSYSQMTPLTSIVSPTLNLIHTKYE